ncbi:MAG: GNAT family N-acetyltransferase [Bacillota bacterium]|nr:GNAT family N-acetyltransferase [Bacillota bacterium]
MKPVSFPSMSAEFRAARAADLESLVAFYDDIIDWLDATTNYPRWIRGVYPAADYLGAAIRAGELFLLEEDGRILAAGGLNHDVPPGYETVDWGVEARPDEIYAIHAFGTHPTAMGRGAGSRLVAELVELARRRGMRAIRLDVIAGNEPARAFYRRAGFAERSNSRLYYKDTGWESFTLLEYVL